MQHTGICTTTWGTEEGQNIFRTIMEREMVKEERVKLASEEGKVLIENYVNF